VKLVPKILSSKYALWIFIYFQINMAYWAEQKKGPHYKCHTIERKVKQIVLSIWLDKWIFSNKAVLFSDLIEVGHPAYRMPGTFSEYLEVVCTMHI
jgi:hypothetical protein